MNFWSSLILGLTDYLGSILNLLPVGNVNPVLATGATILYFAIAPILIFVGSFVNLQLFATVIGTILTLEGVRIILAPLRLIFKLLPFLGK